MLCERRISRAAVLRRSEQTRLLSANDDEVGGFRARCASRAQKRPGLISQTLEGCRRGRSGVRPLRQPVATRLLKIPQKMNPKNFGESRLHFAPPRPTLRRSNLFRSLILRPARAAQLRRLGAPQHPPPAQYGKQAARRSDVASILLSTFVPVQQSEASGPH